jgi:transcriptional regulator with GAF, ATPase, and Fis domain
MIDENAFFRSAALSILGTLNIETALCRLLAALKPVMPADDILVHVYDPGLKSVRTLARATAEGGFRIDRVTPVPVDPRKPTAVFEVVMIDGRNPDPVTKAMGEAFGGKPNSSMLLMRLVLDDNRVGTVTLHARGLDMYTEDHKRLFSLLHEPFAMALTNALSHEDVVRLSEALADDSRYFQRELRSGQTVIGEEFGLKETMEMVRQVAPLLSPVLILGETGTGKEVIANAIHNLSNRRKGPFIKVNCGAIPDALIDSELFGHEKGAFTGAMDQKRGRFERADKGTIFLDEIGELPPNAQVRLLRVLQSKEFERVGGTTSVRADIRVIAATHRDLETMVKKNEFREDLWFRLNVFPIPLPPLRERKADIPALVHYLLGRKSREMGLPAIPTLAPGAMDRLMAYSWPGNVRELDNVVERATILSRGKPLDFSSLIGPALKPEVAQTIDTDRNMDLNEMNVEHIRKALAMAEGRVNGPGGAAEILGINPSTLRHRMRKLGIPFGRG